MGNLMKCLTCNVQMLGRSDKKFCSMSCKNQYHFERKKETKDEVKIIDSYLHRNREILKVLMGKYGKLMTKKIVLDQANFRWDYCTGFYKNKEGKQFYLVYDFAYCQFTNGEVMLIRKSK